MKKIKNIDIRWSKNIGEVEDMYESMSEIMKAFPRIDQSDYNIAERKLKGVKTIGLVMHEDAREDRPYFINVTTSIEDGEPIDKYEILASVPTLIDVPVTHEKLLKRKR